MIEAYVLMDRCHDDCYGRFMEQRNQKLNNPEQSGMDDSLPFPIEPLRAVLSTLPRERVSNSNSDSGVNSAHVLSPAMPVTADNSHNPQPYLMPSTSRTIPPSAPLTPIQQIISFSRKFKAQEPKTYRSQPDHPNSQSVLRPRTRQDYKL